MQSTAPPHLPSKHEPELPARPVGAIRELPVPRTGPPYDDEPAGDPSVPGPVPATASTGGNALGSRTAAPATFAAAASCPDKPHQVSTNYVRSPRQSACPPADPDPWPRQFAQVLAETLAGVRPAHQLTPWTSDRARRQIRQLGPLLACGQLPRVRRIMTSAPASGALEMTAVVGCGERIRVLAVRLERNRGSAETPGGWYCTAVESA